jgi:ubiquitin carboxyl-terminal hydrolase 2/21
VINADSFQLFVAEETLDGEEKPTCESCKSKQKCTKWYSFERWPKILVVHLKRFAPAGSYRAKLSMQIDTPLRNLDLRFVRGPFSAPSK